MEDAHSEKPASPPFQNRLSLLLLGLLVLIAAIVLWVQNRYEPARWREQAGNPAPPSKSRLSLPDGVIPLSPTERYSGDNVSDKINGKADLYLSAGFKSLESRRFALAKDKDRWMERYVYHMDGLRNAFAVYSAQRRSDSRAVSITPYAYFSSNGLFMVHGPYYLEFIASEASDAMQTHLKALGEAFVREHPEPTGKIVELDLFASDQRRPGSRKLIADSAFGIQGMDWVFTADYADEQNQATAFIAKRDDAVQARAMAEAFIAFWNEYGAESVAAPDDLSMSRIVFILDNFEIAMVHHSYVFGVHEASSLEFGLKVVAQLMHAIEEAGR